MYDGSVWGKMRLNFVTKSDFVYFGRTLRLYNMICNRSYFIPLLEFFSWLPIGCLLISIFSNRSENLKLWIQFRHWLLITNVWPPMLLHVWTPIRASYRSFWMCKSDYHAPPPRRDLRDPKLSKLKISLLQDERKPSILIPTNCNSWQVFLATRYVSNLTPSKYPCFLASTTF